MAASVRRADVGHPAGVGRHDQVEVALARAGLGVHQRPGLRGQRPDRLAQQPRRAREHRQLAPAAGHDAALEAHPVADVDRPGVGEPLLPHLRPRGHDLEEPALVLEAQEDQAAVVALEHHAAGHVHDDLGLGPGLERPELLADLGQRVVARIRDRVGVDAARAEGLDLREAPPPLLCGAPGQPGRGGGRLWEIRVVGDRRLPAGRAGGTIPRAPRWRKQERRCTLIRSHTRRRRPPPPLNPEGSMDAVLGSPRGAERARRARRGRPACASRGAPAGPA